MSTVDRILPPPGTFLDRAGAPKFFSTSVPRIAQPPRTIAIRYRDQSQGAFHATGAFESVSVQGCLDPKGRPHAHAKHSVSRAVSISVDFADCGPSSRG